MSIATLFPARRQPDGRVWYLAAGKDGWTANIDFAHPDYRASDAPQPIDTVDRSEDPAATPVAPEAVSEPPAITTTTKEMPVTVLTEDGEIAPRTTQWMLYPLPPETPRPKSKFGTWGWYQLPDPQSGRATGFPRATTIAETLDDTYGLNKWKRRETAKRIFQLATMPPDTKLHPSWDITAAGALEAVAEAMSAPKVTALDDALDTIDNLLGGADARELGECVHAWLEALDMGLVLLKDVPDVVRPHVIHARKVIAHRGLVMLPEYVERTVLNDQCSDQEVVAGKLDRIARIVTTGELVLVDVKTSKDLQYSWLSFGVQVGGVYGWATKMLSLDGASWEPMPEIRKDFAILLHVPSDQPAKAAAITIDMWWGAEVFQESLATRVRRKEAKVVVPRHAIPAPSAEAVRYAEARLALSEIETAEQGQAVYETYQDVWDDDLGEFATTVAELV
jgi:hypothetical protein